MLSTYYSTQYIESLLEPEIVYATSEETRDTYDFTDDIEACCDEIYIRVLCNAMTATQYAEVKATQYQDYTDDQKKLFYAECYLTAALFLEKWVLKNETEKFSQTFDFNTKTQTTTKSGKQYTAERYYEKGHAYLSSIKYGTPASVPVIAIGRR